MTAVTVFHFVKKNCKFCLTKLNSESCILVHLALQLNCGRVSVAGSSSNKGRRMVSLAETRMAKIPGVCTDLSDQGVRSCFPR